MKLMNLMFFTIMIFFQISKVNAKIVTHNGELFIVTNQERVPLFLVNELIEKGKISKVKLYGGGSAHLISFSKEDEQKEKLYSVDEKGFIYSITPFTDFVVTEVDDSGKFKFKEIEDKKYFVNQKGFFLY